MSTEKVEVAVIGAQYIAHVACHHRLELKHVAYEQQLLASEWLTLIAGVEAQQFVDEIYYVGPYHRNLVDDYELEFTYEFDENRRIFHAFGQAFAVKVGVFGRDRLERYSEKRVECLATGIDSRYAGRSEHYVWFVGMACDVAQKRRFACACLAGQKY